MAGTLTISAEQVIAQCEQGIYEPWHGTEPIDLLARGIVESANGNPEVAKDLLSAAYWTLEGEWKDKAGVQLSIAYWRGGEKAEAGALLETLPVSFDVLLTRAILETDSDPNYALELLSEAETYDVSKYKRGRLHNQRGMCYRLLGEPSKAVEEYQAALYFFGDCPLRSFVENNLAGVLSRNESHAAIDSAIESLSGPHLGQAYERKAQTLRSDQNLERAEVYATWAIDLLSAANRRTWLIEALFTRASIRIDLENFGAALIDLRAAQDIAVYLGDRDLEFQAAMQIYQVSKNASKLYHIRSVELALETSLSLNGAAQKLGTSRQALQEFMRTNHLESNSRRRKSIIKKV